MPSVTDLLMKPGGYQPGKVVQTGTSQVVPPSNIPSKEGGAIQALISMLTSADARAKQQREQQQLQNMSRVLMGQQQQTVQATGISGGVHRGINRLVGGGNTTNPSIQGLTGVTGGQPGAGGVGSSQQLVQALLASGLGTGNQNVVKTATDIAQVMNQSQSAAASTLSAQASATNALTAAQGSGVKPAQRETKYVPISEGDDKGKFQLSTVDKITNKTQPVLRNKKPIILTEKQVLIAEGKKAQSLIDPFQNKFLAELGTSEAERITALKVSAQDSRESLAILQQAEKLLNEGMFTGTGANVKTQLSKFLKEFDIRVGGRKASNTEAYASMMGLQVGKIIKAFGAGTGLSDADREYAEKIVAGKVTLSEGAIRRLIDINRRIAIFNINEYNDQSERAKESLQSRDFFQKIEIPDNNALGTPQPKTQEEIQARLEALRKQRDKIGGQ